MLRKDCVDASFGAFLDLLKWVCWKRGVFFMRVNPNGTSQTCPHCQATVAKPLNEREHICPECGYRTNRDHAAAEMVLLRGLDLAESRSLGGFRHDCDLSKTVPVGNRGMETACAGELAGMETSSQVPKTLLGKTRKSKK